MEKNKENSIKETGKKETNEIMIEGLQEQDARAVKEIFLRFIKAYKESGEEQEKFEWLEKQLKEELPEKSEQEILDIKEEIIDSEHEYNADFQDMVQKAENGISKERWFADRLEEGAKGIAVNNYGNYLNNVERVMKMANQQMLNKVLRQDGKIKECLNLDGFIAEQWYVNNFNSKKALEKSVFGKSVISGKYAKSDMPDILEQYAEIPKEGQPYGKNSVDIQIRDKGGVLHRYQVKFGKDAESTIKMLKRGNYNNQIIVVPSDQVEKVQAAFPGKTVIDHIGGTDKVLTKSDSLTKEEVKRLQNEIQETGTIPRTDWNIYNTRELAINLGKQAGIAGMQAAFLTTGLDLAGKVMNGETIDGSEVIENALKSGADTGIKAAAGGALTVASERGVISILPVGTTPGTITKIACVGIENIKIMMKVAKGELTVSEALEQMGRTSTAMIIGLSSAGFGAAAGAAALAWIPIVGPIVGGLVGGMVGYAAGSKFGETIYNGAKKIASTGKKVVKKVWESVKSIGQGIRDILFS